MKKFLKVWQIVDDKTRVGDWEINTIIGADKKACEIEVETIRIMTPLKDKIYTITSDNGLAPKGHFLRAVF